VVSALEARSTEIYFGSAQVRMKFGSRPPHVLVLSNYPPDLTSDQVAVACALRFDHVIVQVQLTQTLQQQGLSADRWNLIDLEDVSDMADMTDIFPPHRFPQVGGVWANGDPLNGFPNHAPYNPNVEADGRFSSQEEEWPVRRGHELKWAGSENDEATQSPILPIMEDEMATTSFEVNSTSYGSEDLQQLTISSTSSGNSAERLRDFQESIRDAGRPSSENEMTETHVQLAMSYFNYASEAQVTVFDAQDLYDMLTSTSSSSSSHQQQQSFRNGRSSTSSSTLSGQHQLPSPHAACPESFKRRPRSPTENSKASRPRF
jgi:hypothetical protein